jgi:hypothetical protein
MSIFSLAPILAIALNMRSSAASSTATSSPLFPASFSLSTLLISPASTVHFYSISIASSMAHNSHISLSTVGSGNYLSLLLHNMDVKFSPFSLLQKAKNLF